LKNPLQDRQRPAASLRRSLPNASRSIDKREQGKTQLDPLLRLAIFDPGNNTPDRRKDSRDFPFQAVTIRIGAGPAGPPLLVLHPGSLIPNP